MKMDLVDVRITTDEFQFVVQKLSIIQATKEGSKIKTKPENVGKSVWSNIAYCSTLNQALKHVGKKIVLENNDLEVIVEKLEELENTIAKFTGIFEVRGTGDEN